MLFSMFGGFDWVHLFNVVDYNRMRNTYNSDAKNSMKANNVKRAAIERNHARPRVRLVKRKK